MEKALRETQTLRAGSSKAEPKKFRLAADPQARDGQKSHYFYLQTHFDEDRCMQFRVIVVTDPPTHKQTNKQTLRQDRLQYTAPQLTAQCNKKDAFTYILLYLYNLLFVCSTLELSVLINSSWVEWCIDDELQFKTAKRSKAPQVTPLFWNGFSAITSLLFVKHRKE